MDRIEINARGHRDAFGFQLAEEAMEALGVTTNAELIQLALRLQIVGP